TGLGLAPIVMAATSLSNAVILGLAVLLLLTPTRVLAALLARHTYPRFRGLVYALCAAIIYIPVYLIEHAIFGVGIEAVGLYLPLLVVEPIVIKRYERSQQEALPVALRKGISTTLGFLIALFVTAALREFLAFGTLFGFALTAQGGFPMASSTAGGFLLIGLLAALWRWLGNLFKKYVNLEAKQQL
ncbi:MAG: Rnf-Nqr domain containing protein, partial [Pygmaiobacter sp.]